VAAAPDPPVRLIAIDWGTSALRAWLLGAEARRLGTRETPHGIMRLPQGGFAEALDAAAGDWIRAHPALPIVACGMVGSAQGWREVPYRRTPADAAALAEGLAAVDIGDGRHMHIVPGILHDATLPDVMRGEETQIVGALQTCDEAPRRRLFVLPGTHSKWVSTAAACIVSLRTFLTGEVYAALREHTILGRLMTDGGGPDPAAFALGLRTAGEQHGEAGLLGNLFSARSLALTGRLAGGALPDYLSGLLIGAELAGARAMFPVGGFGVEDEIGVVGSASLSARYVEALRAVGHRRIAVHADAAVDGLWNIARRAGLVVA
jgi:2-dehydro-3-deoxygalactonokinase